MPHFFAHKMFEEGMGSITKKAGHITVTQYKISWCIKRKRYPEPTNLYHKLKRGTTARVSLLEIGHKLMFLRFYRNDFLKFTHSTYCLKRQCWEGLLGHFNGHVYWISPFFFFLFTLNFYKDNISPHQVDIINLRSMNKYIAHLICVCFQLHLPYYGKIHHQLDSTRDGESFDTNCV